MFGEVVGISIYVLSHYDHLNIAQLCIAATHDPLIK